MRLLPRKAETEEVLRRLRRSPVVAVVGARQVGKSTLARQVAAWHPGPVHVFDLEDPDRLRSLAEPMLALRGLRGLVVLDEVQRLPGLFEVLRVLADRPGRPARFLVLGSASPGLLRQSSESLAGRISYHELRGLALDEVGPARLDRLWLRGGLPPSYTARSEADSLGWRQDFVRTFLERDIPQLGIRIPAAALRRFWSMLAHWHGQTWNASPFAQSLGVTDHTVRGYLDLLAGTYVVTVRQPWHENLRKRQVKSPRVFVADTGILHAFLGIGDRATLEGHPRCGASWESFAAAQVVRRLGAREEECFTWGTYGGAELDLLVVRGRKRWGFEFKRTGAPVTTKSMRIAAEALGPEEIVVVHAGNHSFPMADGIRAVAAARILRDLRPLT